MRGLQPSGSSAGPTQVDAFAFVERAYGAECATTFGFALGCNMPRLWRFAGVCTNLPQTYHGVAMDDPGSQYQPAGEGN